MSQIRVLHNYGGVPTNFRRILPGVYETDDPTLFGLASQLVANGHAVAVDAPEQQVIPAEPEPEVATVPIESLDDIFDEPVEETPEHLDLSAMTINELEGFANESGVNLEAIEGSGAGGRVLKADLIAAIGAHEA